MKDIDGWGFLGSFIGFILSVVFLIAIIAFFKNTDEKISIKNWNNGVCPIDGTHWVYNNSSVSNGWTTIFIVVRMVILQKPMTISLLIIER